MVRPETDPRREWPARIVLPRRQEMHVARLLPIVLTAVIRVTPIGLDRRPGQHVTSEAIDTAHITPTARRQKELDWLTRLGDQQLHFEAEEVPFLAGDVARYWSSG